MVLLRIRKINLISTITIVLILISLLSTVSAVTDKDTLIVQIEESILHIDNRYRSASSVFDEIVASQYQGYLGMIAPGETIAIMPGVAESWHLTYGDEHVIEWVFQLREGLTFHDGSPIDAKSIKYSMVANLMAYYSYDNMSHALREWEDDGYEVGFPANDPNGDGLTVIFSGEYFPDPMFPFDVMGAWNRFTLVPYGVQGLYSDSTFVCEDQLDRFEDAPISCGPYKYHSHVGEDYVQLERFDDWFGWGMTFTANNGQDYTFPDKDVAFKYVRFRTIPESAMALVELRTGGVDVTTSPLSSESDFLDVVSEPNFDGYRKSALGGDIMGLNIQGDWPTYWGGSGNFPVSQDWFRKALSHTINRTNIVENVYLGLAEERNTIFPDWILAKFPNIDTSSYYDFDQGFAEAEALLDAQGYTALGFPNEPDNRFGYGVYANETEVNSVEQSSGRHFSLITTNCDHCVKRAIAIQKDFAQIGIYTDIALYEFGVYLDNLYSGDTGFDYNTTGPQPDPNFIGPDWDFYVGGFGGNYETPWDYIAYQNFVYWLYYGYGGYSWYNIDFEIAYAKATDGWGYVDYYDAPPADYPYPVPEWSNYDVQFVQACEDAGYLMSQAMNKVPLVWKTNTYAYNSHLQNFVGARNSLFHVAYSYWDQNTGEPTTTTTTTGSTTTTTIPKITPFLEIYAVIGLSLLVVPWFRKRRIK